MCVCVCVWRGRVHILLHILTASGVLSLPILPVLYVFRFDYFYFISNIPRSDSVLQLL